MRTLRVAVLASLAQIIDASNEYERVIIEHEALHGLLDQLGGEEAGVIELEFDAGYKVEFDLEAPVDS
jgi:hypothetical protein